MEHDDRLEIQETLIIPENTRFDERNIVVEGDVLVGPDCILDFGLMGKKIYTGEKNRINGDITGEEVKIEDWSEISGDVVSEGDCFLGEFVTIRGRLRVAGDLEIGRNVKIEKGFEAKGWIEIKNPVPVIIFIFLYILELIRTGKIEELERLLQEMDLDRNVMMIPSGSRITLEEIRTTRDISIEGNCRINGNIRGRNVNMVRSEVFGSVRGTGRIRVVGSIIHGDVSGDEVFLEGSSVVLGRVRGRKVFVEEGVKVEGEIIGREGMKILTPLRGVKSDDELGSEDFQDIVPSSG